MADYAYMASNKKYNRPQAMLFSNNKGEIVTSGDLSLYAPIGTEGIDFIVLSDHNRAPIDFKPTRLETRQRMVNGRMRSYHIADKQNISTSWSLIPSRSYSLSDKTDVNSEELTVDGGAGGLELLDWYDSHTGSFFVYLSYDSNYTANFKAYNEVIEVFFSNFDHSVQKRGGSHDLWNVSLSLEEV